VRLPLKVVQTDGQRATSRTLTAPYYGWVLVGVLGVTEAISWGVLYYAFSVFLTPMEDDLGWSRAETTGAFSLALVLSGFAAIGAGRWLDRHGARALMTAGSCIGVVLVLAWAAADTLPVLYVVWAAIGVVMATVLYEPAFAVVTVWFDRKRVRALTAVTLIAGFSSTVFLPLSAWLVEAQGWRMALVSLALILAVGTIPAHALLLRRRPEDLGLHPDGEPAATSSADRRARTSLTPGAALRDPTFRWVTLAFCLSTAVAFGAQVRLVPILLERGFSPILAATLAGSIGATQVLGRVLMTPLAGRFSLRSLSVVVLAIQPVALLVLLLVPELAGVIAFIVLFGAAKGCLTLVRPAFVADLYGPAHYASIAGVLAFAVTLAQATAPLGAGAAYDAIGWYDPILWVMVLVSVLATVCLLPARRDFHPAGRPCRRSRNPPPRGGLAPPGGPADWVIHPD
jgi:MFS family permease